MHKLSNSAVILLEDLLQRRGAQIFGSWFQDAVSAALGTMPAYQGCYVNPGAGQPDIIAGTTGFEVKTTADGAVNLSGNYHDIRKQYPNFKLVGLRTDVRPFPLWVLDMPVDPPTRVNFERVMDPRTPVDEVVGWELAERLSRMLVAAGTAWSRAEAREEAKDALRRAIG